MLISLHDEDSWAIEEISSRDPHESVWGLMSRSLLRMALARRHLTDSNDTIKEIAETCQHVRNLFLIALRHTLQAKNIRTGLFANALYGDVKCINCPICLENMYPNVSVRTWCGHFFHLHCILTASDVQETPRCPLCRERIDARDFIRRENGFLNSSVAETAFSIYNQQRKHREILDHVLDSTLRTLYEMYCFLVNTRGMYSSHLREEAAPQVWRSNMIEAFTGIKANLLEGIEDTCRGLSWIERSSRSWVSDPMSLSQGPEDAQGLSQQIKSEQLYH